MRHNNVKLTIVNKHVYMLNKDNLFLEKFLDAKDVVKFAERLLRTGEEAFGIDAMTIATDEIREQYGQRQS